jgi:uroporphyrinogen-III decarboxylase
MPDAITHRQILNDLLQGRQPARPLFAPIAFTLAARLENLPPHIFLTNPTKISNALRQIRAPLRTDALSCYFDPLLEVEALGATIEWAPDHAPSKFSWPSAPQPGQLPERLASPEDTINRGRVPVALEVIRRLKATLRGESLLIAGVSGPLTVATRLTAPARESLMGHQHPSTAAFELSTAVITEIAKAFAEAGANLILLREEFPPVPNSPAADEWLSMLQPIFNIVRFYEALPILQIVGKDPLAENEYVDFIANVVTDCIACLPLQSVQNLSVENRERLGTRNAGIGLPPEVFQADGSDVEQALRDIRPAIITTMSDLPPTTDPKRVAAFSELIRTFG